MAKDDGKTVAIVAYLTLIGWIVALIMNSSKKTDLGSFHIRQALIIGLTGLVLGVIPLVNLVAWVFVLVLWVMGLIGAVNGEKKLVPVIGKYGQDWFKGL